jgi:hypothetical protein
MTWLTVIGGVMVRVLASSAVDRGFEPRLGQTKDYKIGICCFSAKNAVLRERAKTSRHGIRIMCVGLDQSGHHHHHFILSNCTRLAELAEAGFNSS